MEGKGELVFPNGEKYVGTLKNNLPEGEGVKTFSGGDKYTGQFKEGYEHGFGEKISEKWVYEGNWAKGSQCGEGKLVFKEGDLEFYEGHF